MEALKGVEETIVADVSKALVTQNTVGSVTIPSTPPFDVSLPYIMLLGCFVAAITYTDRVIRSRLGHVSTMMPSKVEPKHDAALGPLRSLSPRNLKLFNR
jgi:hypothetical protein